MNRADRRKAQKGKPAWQRMTLQERQAALVKNGITPKDLDNEFNRGWTDGYRTGAENAAKTAYAAACMALKEMHGFGRKRCKAFLKVMDERVLYSLTSEDEINAVWDALGLKLKFKEPFDRIEDVRNG